MAETHTNRGAIAGLFAAVATPIHADGRIDLGTSDRLVDLLVDAGVHGICIAGATGEYPHFETADRKAIIRRAAERLPLPTTPTRQLQIATFREWLPPWLRRNGLLAQHADAHKLTPR